jgi:hypothetical protein
MWQCTKCRETIEDSFDLCWNCGTSKDGVEDPSFRKAEDTEITPSAAAFEVRPSTVPGTALTEDAIQTGEGAARMAPAVPSKCPHCGGLDLIRAVKLGLTGTAGNVGLDYQTLLVLVGTEPLYADLCKACGSVARLYVGHTERPWITG